MIGARAANRAISDLGRRIGMAQSVHDCSRRPADACSVTTLYGGRVKLEFAGGHNFERVLAYEARS